MDLKNCMKYLKNGLVALILITTAACGTQSSKSSNSLKKYSAFKKSLGPIHNSPSPTQTYIPSDLFVLELDPTTSTNFTAGQKNSLRFRTSVNLPGTKYRLISRDLPHGSEPLKDLGQGLWEFTWNPNPALIPNNSADNISGGFHVSLEFYETTNPQTKSLIQSLSTEREVQYFLFRISSSPEILDITGTAHYPEITKMNEGDIIELIITVKDPSSSPSQKPTLIPIPVSDRTTMNPPEVSGLRFLFLETEPKLLSSGLWEFRASFNTLNNSVPEFNINGQAQDSQILISHLNFQVKGANQTFSTETMRTFEITYRHELLKPSFKADPELQILNQGSTWSYSFESYIPSTVGTLTTFLSEDSIKQPGVPKIICKVKGRELNHQFCRIDWKIPCNITPGDIVIQATAAAEYEGQNTSAVLEKKITLLENKNCLLESKPSNIEPSQNNQKPKVKQINTEPQKKQKKSVKSIPKKTLKHKVKPFTQSTKSRKVLVKSAFTIQGVA